MQGIYLEVEYEFRSPPGRQMFESESMSGDGLRLVLRLVSAGIEVLAGHDRAVRDPSGLAGYERLGVVQVDELTDETEERLGFVVGELHYQAFFVAPDDALPDEDLPYQRGPILVQLVERG